MKATELLKRQHHEVKALFQQLEKGNGRTRELLEKLADDLAAHTWRLRSRLGGRA